MVLSWSAIIVQTLLLVALIDSGAGVSTAYLYHIPWACSVLHASGELVGACAILESTRVLVSIDNFLDRIEDPHYPPTPYYKNLSQLRVWAGTNYMDPSLKFTKPPTYAQMRTVVKFYVPFKAPQNVHGNWDFRVNPEEISKRAGVEFDAFGLAFNVGILVVDPPFVSSAYLLPMLITGPNVKENTEKYITEHEKPKPPRDTCITYSWNHKLNRIRYHKVMYIQKKNCREAYCYWKISNCTEFPKKDHLLCFKSVKYADLCPNARGTALYCVRHSKAVIAILTTAPSCGQRNMPGVYTTLPKVIDFFEKTHNIKFEVDRRPKYDIFALDQKNSDYQGIL